MTFSSTRWAARLLVVGFAVSCGDEPTRSERQPGSLSPNGSSIADVCFGTSEKTSLGIDDPRVAHYAEAVAGQHEHTLIWKQYARTASARGYTDRTKIVFDVQVTAGVESVFSPDPEVEGMEDCAVTSSYGLDTVIQFTTEDGALQAALPHELRCRDDVESVGTQCTLLNSEVLLEMSDLRGSFELEVDPRFSPEVRDGIAAEALLFLTFTDGGVRGRLRPQLSWPEVDTSRLPFRWSPVEASFPGKRCAGELVFYDDLPAQWADEAVQAEQAIVADWPSGPLPAGWAPSNSANALRALEVNVEVGRATAACFYKSGVEPTVFLPVTITSSDGRVNYSGEWAARAEDEGLSSVPTLPGTGPFAVAGGFTGFSGTPDIHSSEFPGVSGVQGIDLDESEAARVSVSLTRREGVVSGRLSVSANSPETRRNDDFDALHWGAGVVTR